MTSLELIPVLHNVMSAQRVLEAAKLVYGLGFKSFVVSKALGAAAQSGVPEAQKLAIRLKRNIFFLVDIDDVIEVFNPDRVLTVTPAKYGGEPLSKVVNDLSGKVVVVFGGLEPGLSMREIEKGMHVFPDKVVDDIGSIGLLAITLYMLKELT